MRVTETVAVRDADGGRTYCCVACDRALAAVTATYKSGCLCEQAPLSAANPHASDRSPLIDDELVFRRYYCPGCAVLIESEIAPLGSEPIWDVDVRGDAS
ncbi:acetone carboxylase subunit gamma [Conexibacter sp. CPCC 206217]|uniref:acetone carboxylase subunit gamma n=1 Tax=Conexibacter sp. CPCC 206217 TaxID=3064574 RepID=UPI002725A2B1|nr:acetone carboxylase subunit gamma [Conexibacter sp. CPCC 206217]MDO8208810.1 acetone carboxylase subunit gamma [Conexibacter sp. CPCC 206217]